MTNFQTQSGQNQTSQKSEQVSTGGQNKIAQQGESAQLSNTGLSEVKKLSNKELLHLCQNCGANIRKLQRQFAVYLIEVNKRCICRDWGFHSIGEFAAKLAGMGFEIVNRILNVAQKLEDKPKLMALMLECGWAKLEIVANIVEPETQDFWVDKLKSMSLVTLQTFVREIRNQEMLKAMSPQAKCEPNSILEKTMQNGQELQQNIFESKSNTPQQQALIQGFVNEAANMSGNFQKASITIFVRPEIEGKLRLFKFKLEKQQKKALNWEDVMEEFLKMAKERTEMPAKSNSAPAPAPASASTKQKTPILNNKSIQVKLKPELNLTQQSQQASQSNEHESPQAQKKITHYISIETQRQLKVEYNEMCGYPGCNKPAENKHHTKRFSLEHDHKNIVPVCKIHHQLAHHGLIKNEEMKPIDAQTGVQNWKLQLRADERAPKFKVDQMVSWFRKKSMEGVH
ncbi:MAG: hypothetical protein WC843_04295 [Candidatus Gracilibacteria bacterium]|jgi:hypothetical protein